MTYSHRFVLFDGLSATSSTYTSGWVLVADYRQMSLEWQDGGNSRLTLAGTNLDGLRAALPATTSAATTSALTGITSSGMFTVDPGVRWLRAERNSADSLSQVYLQARS